MWECQTLGAPDTERQEQNKAESEMAWPRAPQGDDGRAVSKDSCAALLSAPTTHPQCPLPAKAHGISAGRAQVCLGVQGLWGGERSCLDGEAILQGKREAVGRKASW